MRIDLGAIRNDEYAYISPDGPLDFSWIRDRFDVFKSQSTFARENSSGEDIPGDATTTTSIAPGEQLISEIDFVDDIDWIAFDFDGTNEILFEIIFNFPTPDIVHLRLYDSNGVEVPFSSEGFQTLATATDSVLFVSGIPSGQYFLQLTSRSPQPYIVNLSLVEDDYEGDTSTTGTIAVGETVTGVGNSTFDHDWFRFDAVEGQVLQFTIDAERANNSSIAFYDANGERLDNSAVTFRSDPDRGDSLYFVYAPSDGPFYISFERYESAYSFTLDELFEQPADTSTTAHIYFNDDRFGGYLDGTPDVDWFRIDIANPQIVNFLFGPSIGGTVEYTIYREDGTTVVFHEALDVFEVDRAQKIEFDEAGTYYLSFNAVPDDFGFSFYGPYTIIANVAEEGTPIPVDVNDHLFATEFQGGVPLAYDADHYDAVYLGDNRMFSAATLSDRNETISYDRTFVELRDIATDEVIAKIELGNRTDTVGEFAMANSDSQAMLVYWQDGQSGSSFTHYLRAMIMSEDGTTTTPVTLMDQQATGTNTMAVTANPDGSFSVVYAEEVIANQPREIRLATINSQGVMTQEVSLGNSSDISLSDPELVSLPDGRLVLITKRNIDGDTPFTGESINILQNVNGQWQVETTYQYGDGDTKIYDVFVTANGFSIIGDYRPFGEPAYGFVQHFDLDGQPVGNQISTLPALFSGEYGLIVMEDGSMIVSATRAVFEPNEDSAAGRFLNHVAHLDPEGNLIGDQIELSNFGHLALTQISNSEFAVTFTRQDALNSSQAMLLQSVYRVDGGRLHEPSFILSDAADSLTGTPRNDHFYGLDGADELRGAGGEDEINGGDGADTLFGEAGNDDLLGGESLALTETEAQVYRIYQATLGRAPDAAGLANWTDALSSGAQTLLQVIEGFVGSAEFQSVYGSLNDTAFVELLYNNVLGRSADPAGLQSWLNALAGGASRADVVRGFSESAEFINGTAFETQVWATFSQFGDVEGQVYRLYQATLGRSPDPGGFQNWVRALEDGAALTDIIPGFVDSSEFQTRYGALDDSAFIELLYNNVLGRGSDPGGLQSWLDVLANGGTRADVVRGFSESAELISNTGDALANFIRDVNGDWNDVLIGGVGDDDLFGGRGADRFVFDVADTGSDTVHGLEAWDILEMTGFGYTTEEEFSAHLTQSGSDVLFSDQGVSITFTNTDVATVSGLLDLGAQSSPELSKASDPSGMQNTNEMDGLVLDASAPDFDDLIAAGTATEISPLIATQQQILDLIVREDDWEVF